MTDFFLVIGTTLTIGCFALLIHWIEFRGTCRHKWEKWDDPENTGVDVIQRRTCAKCNLMDVRTIIPNASLETCEEQHDVAISPLPADTVDSEAGARVPSATTTTTT